jgi:hypothetical protein
MKKMLAIAAAGLLLAGCGGKGNQSGEYPDNFNTIGDAGRVAYMMQKVEPDSLARWIIRGALGQEPGVRVDTFAIATNYAYEHLRDDALDSFCGAYDSYVESLPIADKMKIYKLAATEDPQQLGYKLGLEYMSSIRDNHKSAAEVEKELKEFKKACGTDTETYDRFVIGFKTVLQMDHGKDVPEDIYQKFINL